MKGAEAVLTAAQVGAGDRGRVGGKAAHLARIGACSASVPPWFVLTTEAFESALATVRLRSWIEETLAAAGSDPERLVATSSLISERILGLDIPADLRRSVEAVRAKILPRDALVAVRSSAPAEDAVGDSFAGLHESRLFVGEGESFWEAVRVVWASAFTPRALVYRAERSLPLAGIALAVVVQEMVEARTSAVMFTVDPLDGDVGRIVLSALWGAGEGLVSAGLDADTFRVEKADGAVEAEIATKVERLVIDRISGAGLIREPVPAELREAPSLEPEEIAEALRLGVELERFLRRPQDIEVAWDQEGRLFLLQSRAVTTVEELGPAAGHRLLWDNSNIVESYSGVTSPMTFSFIRRAYAIVYRNFATVMGVPREVVAASDDVFENMLGYLRGRVYYNLRNWYRVVRMLPGYERNRGFMESMMGVRESARFEEEGPPFWQGGEGVRHTGPGTPALAWTMTKMALRFARIDRIVSDFERHFDERYARYSSISFVALEPHELMALYREMERELLMEWKAPIVNDFFVMVFYGMLKKLCVAWCGDESGTLQNDLLCGEGGIASTEPARRMLEMARAARERPELVELFAHCDAEELAATLPADPRFPEFTAAVASYLGEFGFRCMDELKLEEPPLRDRPAFLYQMIANYLGGDPSLLDATSSDERERRLRRGAEDKAVAEIRLRSSLPARIWRRAVFGRVLRAARTGVRNRENLRFARTKVYGLLRDLLRAMGMHLESAGAIRQRDDVFLLTLDEIWDFVKGTAVTSRLEELVEVRKRENDAYREAGAAPPGDRFETYGMVYHRNRFAARPSRSKSEEEGPLRGTGCCPGEVTGPVKVLSSPAAARLAGEILVAERTDPGWVPLFPAASGLLVERGSILSHSAIVAREMGLPTIVGLRQLTQRVRSGDRVRMDGSAGTVVLIDSDQRPGTTPLA